MASEAFIQRCRTWYRKLLRFYPKRYRERFAEGMEQTFHDLCRERARAGKTLMIFAFLTYLETSAAVVRENATTIMKQESLPFLKTVKYGAIALGGLMVAGIVTLMILSRGKGEDITGIVAPALLVTIMSGIVASVAAVLQKRAQRS
jgi:hypothetical protein